MSLILPPSKELVSLEEAASLAGITEDVLMEFAILSSGWPEEERLTIVFAPGGPWFVEIECRALGVLLDADLAERKPGAFEWPSDATLRN